MGSIFLSEVKTRFLLQPNLVIDDVSFVSILDRQHRWVSGAETTIRQVVPQAVPKETHPTESLRQVLPVNGDRVRGRRSKSIGTPPITTVGGFKAK